MSKVTKEEDELYKLYSETHLCFQQSLSHLKGKLLTLADASFADAQQRKAFKDLVSQTVDQFSYQDTRENVIFAFKQVALLEGRELFADGNCTANPVITE